MAIWHQLETKWMTIRKLQKWDPRDKDSSNEATVALWDEKKCPQPIFSILDIVIQQAQGVTYLTI